MGVIGRESDQFKKLKTELEALKFRKDLLAEENHNLKLRLTTRDATIEELKAEITHLKKRFITMPVHGTVS